MSFAPKTSQSGTGIDPLDQKLPQLPDLTITLPPDLSGIVAQTQRERTSGCHGFDYGNGTSTLPGCSGFPGAGETPSFRTSRTEGASERVTTSSGMEVVRTEERIRTQCWGTIVDRSYSVKDPKTGNEYSVGMNGEVTYQSGLPVTNESEKTE